MKNLLKLTIIATLFSLVVMESQASTGEVTRSGSTWTAKVDGSTKYTGSDMISAINACTSNMGSGTINVRNSGTAVAPDGLRQVNLYSNQTLDFHGTTMTCENALNIYPVKASGRSNVAVKNLKISGVPRYLMHFSNCSDITISNITANTTRGTGIRVESSSDLVISGNIDLHTPGHCIETYTVNGVDIGSVTVQSDNGCGVLFNDSENCNIGNITANNCDPDGHYAGFRTANSNGQTYCSKVYARNCGRGIYIMGNSAFTTVNSVDIQNCNYRGLTVGAVSSGVRVNSGTVKNNANKNIDIWDGASNVCIRVNGTTYGDACGSSSSSSSSSSGGTYYQIKNRNSGLCVGVEGGSSSNNADVEQQACNDSYWRQQWELVDAGNSYLYIKNRNSGKCMRASGSNIVQYTCNTGYWTEMFSRTNLGNGYYLIKNRDTGTCLRVEGSSGSAGASIILATCNTSYWSQQFSFPGPKSAPISSQPSIKDINIYPTIVKNTLNINLSDELKNGTVMKLYNNTGKLILSKTLNKGNNTVDLTHISAGIYFVKISNDKDVVNQKIIKK